MGQMEMKKHGRRKGERAGIDGIMFILQEVIRLKRSVREMNRWMAAVTAQCAQVKKYRNRGDRKMG